MVLTSRRLTRSALALLALVLLAAAFDGWQLVRTQRTNAAIVSGEAIAEAPGQPPEVRFAQAYAQAASAPHEAALNRYRALQTDPTVGAAARYNSANLLVRQAVVVRAGAQPGQAIALLELAKEYYRDVLRDDPAQWDARYNLERAQRLLPDPDEQEEAPAGVPQNRERAATTMRGYSPGLP
ncbi:MAG TPA: hypothetical protein VJO99_16605 [Burkholderiaceae bacterium]|nr:hypothetical protein [Burkholderiaceae bacterium]